MAKQFIRHLEYYGFPDQNVFANETSMDLSDIREKNKEQDKAIEEIDKSEKASKRDLIKLNNKVDSFIGQQNAINYQVAQELVALDGDVSQLKENSNHFNEELSGLTDAVNELIDEFDAISGYTSGFSGISEAINVLSGDVENLSSITVSNITRTDEYIISADTVYARKDNTYTKSELDDKFADVATKSWVLGKGYLTQDEGDSYYAKKSTLNNIDSRLEVVEGDVVKLSNDLNSLSSNTSTKFNSVDGKLSNLENTVNDLTTSTDERLDALEGDMQSVKPRLADVEGNVSLKADKTELASVSGTLSTEISNKVDFTEYNSYKASIIRSINDLDYKKADKTELDALTTRIIVAESNIVTETQNRINSEGNLRNQIVANANEIVNIKSKDAEQDISINDLYDKLANEEANRIASDNSLKGSANDTPLSETIWGAKRYADEKLVESKEYANNVGVNVLSNAKTYTDNKFDNIEQELSSKVDRNYVDNLNSQTKNELSSEINNLSVSVNDKILVVENSVINEKNRASQVEQELTSEVSTLSDRLGAITSWKGTDPEEYDNTGNGVLDVLHREFHEFEKTHGTIKSIEVIDGNLVITYYTIDGEAQAIIPVSSLVDLSDYYTKEETDAKIEEAIENINLEDYYTKEEVNEKIDAKADTSALTEAIDNIVGGASEDYNTLGKIEDKVEEKSNVLESLIEKLGYNENETLVTTNPHEVAFGEYNTSNTGENDADKTIFSVGNGTSDEDRKNAIEIRKDGTVYMWVEGEYMNINRLLAMLAHEIY